MTTAARWIRLGPNGHASLRAASAGFARVQCVRAAPAVIWARHDKDIFSFALVAPLRLAPGRRWRWRAWALAPSIATYRQFGERAYLDGGDLWLGGRRIAESEAAAIGDCAVISSSFLARLPRAHAGWTERNVEDAFRGRIEAQHGWQFENCWPSAVENTEIAEALALEATGAA
jgi:hypothetical protein